MRKKPAIETRIYDKDSFLIAVVLEDGKYVNCIYDPEMEVEGDNFIEEAVEGFPEALPFDDDDDYQMGRSLSLERLVEKVEKESTLIMKFTGEDANFYFGNISNEMDSYLYTVLGEDIWNAIKEELL